MTEILPDLHIGDLGDCNRWSGPKICVLEQPDGQAGCVHSPILTAHSTGLRARMADLEKMAELYERLRVDGPVLIHCGAGIERSPLAAAYILVTRHGHTYATAYNLLQKLRPQVQDRFYWLL